MKHTAGMCVFNALGVGALTKSGCGSVGQVDSAPLVDAMLLATIVLVHRAVRGLCTGALAGARSQLREGAPVLGDTNAVRGDRGGGGHVEISGQDARAAGGVDQGEDHADTEGVCGLCRRTHGSRGVHLRDNARHLRKAGDRDVGKHPDLLALVRGRRRAISLRAGAPSGAGRLW